MWYRSYHINLYVKRFQKTFWYTLFYFILLLALTHRRTDWRTEKRLYPMWAGHPDRVPPGKWKLWVEWHGSSCWLLCLCVLYFVFCAVFKTIRCSQVSPISISKNENYELCISAGFFVMTGKKKVPVVCLAKKKRYSRLSVGCTVLAEKKISSRLFNLY